MTSLNKRQSIALAVAGVLALGLLYVGCQSAATPSPEAAAASSPTPEHRAVSGWGEHGAMYTGLVSMEELVLVYDVIARVQFNSAEQIVEKLSFTPPGGNPREHYVGAVLLTFDVLEYLKGNGGPQVQAVVYDVDYRAATAAEITAKGEDLLEFRDTQWDDREAIVFLTKWERVPSTLGNNNRYHLGLLRANGEDGFTIGSRWAKAWLPAAASRQAGASAASGSSTQRFFTDAPSGGANGASRQARSQSNTITLDGLKKFISDVEAQVTAGGGTEAYRDCLGRKLFLKRWVNDYRARLATEGREYQEQIKREIASGSPAGTEVYEDDDYIGDEPEAVEPSWSGESVLRSGRDAALFGAKWPYIAITARPLPSGEYRFFWAEQGERLILCDALPEAEKTRTELVVTVTAPAGTLHEAFFDPVTLGSGVGADSSNGVIKPAGFTVDGTSTSITGLKYDDSKVVLTLSPHASLSGQKVEFIELDGSVGLSLDVSSATVDSSAGTLTWTVSEEPWGDGDELMLRISTSTSLPPTPTPEPTATPEPAATPTPPQASSVTVTLTPRVQTSLTFTDITIVWTDADRCNSRYQVSVNTSGGSQIKHLGYHDAPETTSVTDNSNWLWDSISGRDWLVQVDCAPAGGSDWYVVGEAELRSGLPSTP